MDPQKSSNPKDYLLNPNHQQCIICYQSQLNLLNCKKCKIILCNQCAIDTKYKQNRCPYKCSDGFEMEVHHSDLKYRCQFSEQCQNVCNSIKEFYEHGRHCKYISAGQKQQEEKRWSYSCSKNHTLEVKIDSYKNLIQRVKCVECNEGKLARAICRKCSEQYCSSCRPFPIIKMHCPMGHQFVKRHVDTINYRCDGCQLAPNILNIDIYDDFICNFGICELCLKDWPEFGQQICYIENLFNYCDKVGDKRILQKLSQKQQQQFKKQHELKLLDEFITAKCAHCQKQRLCYQKCLKCQQLYCYECKRFSVDQNLRCENLHLFKQYNEPMQGQNQQVSELKNKYCLQCSSKLPKVETNPDAQMYVDKNCKIFFCAECLIDSVHYNFDVRYKQISISVSKCPFDSSHLLFFLPAQRDRIGTCNGCNKKKALKFNCGMCKQSQFFCTACIPPANYQKCYCMKQLMVGAGECMICNKMYPSNQEQGQGSEIQKNDDSILGCMSCNFSICRKCQGIGLKICPSLQIQMEQKNEEIKQNQQQKKE